MSFADHHEWVKAAASRLILAGDTLWQALCAEWALLCLDAHAAKMVVQPISDLLLTNPETFSSPIVQLQLFERSPDVSVETERLI